MLAMKRPSTGQIFSTEEKIAYESSYGSSVVDGLSATKVKDPVTSQEAAVLGTEFNGARASLTSSCENAPEECWAHRVCESLKAMSQGSRSVRPLTDKI